ncbi:DNA replication protein DnaC [Parablautia intestinalis]|uniref:DNA replication protein DnaC n=1 Tax=Parablautia intestinalis TaxID=2320100 RepID=A0A3A9AHT4_9FIRM|nr:ATP-binding protein [Parablautia intestinalis]MCI8616010.1 ATP-binding protein [Lachnospiraceae bacterium]MDE7048097.1 ATP-binding protein [Lachnospiraceae bacterium]RKI90937.1 DNA replication protein DnaC [Parablautia intestinalis]
MALTNSQYETIMREYEDRQTASRHLLEERTAEVYARVEGYRGLCESVASLSVSQGRKFLDGDEKALEDLHASLSSLSAQKKYLLRQAGYPDDYLTPVYNCPKCRDTGYVDGSKCHCFKQAIIDLLYEQSGIREQLESENWSTLSYDYYQGDDLQRFQNAVKECKNFIKTFDSDYHNLFFYGTVGTGKSFLSGCIARELIESGHSVIYFSAAGLFETLSRNMFDYKNKDDIVSFHEDLYGCDLLIIDDLGTEYTSNVAVSVFFSLLNQRHLNKKSTIISTNLSLEDLRNRYSDRVFSRITNQYTICKFTGTDIRMLKKRLQNRK